MDKDFVPWFKMMLETKPFQSWMLFTKALEAEFGPSLYECPRSTLFKLLQTTSVSEVYHSFTTLSNRITSGLQVFRLMHCWIVF